MILLLRLGLKHLLLQVPVCRPAASATLEQLLHRHFVFTCSPFQQQGLGGTVGRECLRTRLCISCSEGTLLWQWVGL